MDILLEDSNFRTDIGSQSRYQIKNFVLTRFNLNLPGFKAKVASNEEQYKHWLQHRQDIFLHHCLKSIVHQVNKPYKWLLLFDKSNYFEIFQETLIKVSQYDFIIPVFVEENKNLHQAILEVINSHISDNDDCISMTRLDNDDALSILYLKTLNEYINSLDIKEYTEANPLWVTFNYGVQFNGNIFNLFLQNNNAFLSTVVKVDQSKSGSSQFKNHRIHPLSINHSSLFRLDKTVQIVMTRLPVWMQYIHDQNVLNKMRQTNFIIERSAYDLLAKIFLIPKTQLLTNSIVEPTKNLTDTNHNNLDDIGKFYGTDKSSLNHNYLNIYEKYLSKFKNDQGLLCEIGCFNGASLKMWRDYFPDFCIIGVDIDPKKTELREDRIQVEIGNQEDTEFLDKLCNKYKMFDIIIDDGSHIWNHQQLTFEHLFPYLRNGGIYIIEDIHTSYYEQWKKDSTISTTEYLKLFLDLLISGNRSLAKNNYSSVNEAVINDWEKTIEQVIFLRKSCVIIKKDM